MIQRLLHQVSHTTSLYKWISIVIAVSISLSQSSCRTVAESCIYDPVNSNVRNFPSLRHHKVSGLNIADGMFTGLLEFTPPGYHTDSAKRYPVIIYFHGREAGGSGNSTDLCKILWDGITGTGSSLPPLIEGNGFPEEVKAGGKTYSFLVISPQFKAYNYPKSFPSVDEVDQLVDYVVKTYRVDPSRVYLTGMSTGANMVIEYAASKKSLGKIAAISTASLCDSMNIKTNTSRDINAANLSSNGHGVWFMQCREDARCSIDIVTEWVNAMKVAGGRAPRFTMLDDKDPNPDMHCARYEHNTWFRMYDADFRIDGTNLYEWFLQYTSQPGQPSKHAGE